jgi:hypothetical protein
MGLLDTYATSARFETVGKRVAGKIVRPPVEVQQRDFDSNELLFWDDGNPRMQLVVTVDTGNVDPTVEDDDGERAIYVKGQMLSAVRAALKRARAKTLEPDGYFAVTFIEEEPLPKGKRGKPKKIYAAEYEPPAERADPDRHVTSAGADDARRDHQSSLRDSQKRAAERASARRDDDEPPF